LEKKPSPTHYSRSADKKRGQPETKSGAPLLMAGPYGPCSVSDHDSVSNIASAIWRMLLRLSMASFCILLNASGSESP